MCTVAWNSAVRWESLSWINLRKIQLSVMWLTHGLIDTLHEWQFQKRNSWFTFVFVFMFYCVYVINFIELSHTYTKCTQTRHKYLCYQHLVIYWTQIMNHSFKFGTDTTHSPKNQWKVPSHYCHLIRHPWRQTGKIVLNNDNASAWNWRRRVYLQQTRAEKHRSFNI